MLKYNFDYKITYDSATLTDASDTTYRKDIMGVFDMKQTDDDFFKILSDKVSEIYKELKNHPQIDKILHKLEENIPFKMEKSVIFMYLFRYDLFLIFHKCLQDFNIFAEISRENYELLFKNL
jgi:hypothetical protein